MTQKDRDRIKYLRERIKKNLAAFNEYEEYEKLLLKNGIPKQAIDNYLKREHIDDYKELINERKRYIARKRDNTIETVVVAGLIGLGIAVILNALYNTEK